MSIPPDDFTVRSMLLFECNKIGTDLALNFKYLLFTVLRRAAILRCKWAKLILLQLCSGISF